MGKRKETREEEPCEEKQEEPGEEAVSLVTPDNPGKASGLPT